MPIAPVLADWTLAAQILAFLDIQDVTTVFAQVSTTCAHLSTYFVLLLRSSIRDSTNTPHSGLQGTTLTPVPQVQQRLSWIKHSIDSEATPHDWHRHGFSGSMREVLHAHRQLTAKLAKAKLAERVPIIDLADLPPQRFRAEFLGQRPVVISGLADAMVHTHSSRPLGIAGGAGGGTGGFGCCDPAESRWSYASLYRRCFEAEASSNQPNTEGIGPIQTPLRVGETETGDDVGIQMSDYLAYAAAGAQQDDTPLYVFEEDVTSYNQHRILPDYTVQGDYFADDLLHLLGAADRPPYKWWLLGVAGTGTDIHVDPPGTDAWNALLSGTKEWVLVDPAFDANAVHQGTVADDEPAFCWFQRSLEAVATNTALGGVRPGTHIVSQPAGSVIYVPSGWWHTAWNSTDTLAVTQNFISWKRFCRDAHVYLDAQGGPKMAEESESMQMRKLLLQSVEEEASSAGSPRDAQCASMNFAEFIEQLYGLLDTDTSIQWLRAVHSYAEQHGLYRGARGDLSR